MWCFTVAHCFRVSAQMQDWEILSSLLNNQSPKAYLSGVLCGYDLCVLSERGGCGYDLYVGPPASHFL